MENVIYNELIYRGYNVSVGVVTVFDHSEGKTQRVNLEVDFIAKKFYKIIYIQCALYIPDDEKNEQELRPLRKIDNSFKTVLTTKYEGDGSYDENGILHMNLFDFLLDEKSLD